MTGHEAFVVGGHRVENWKHDTNLSVFFWEMLFLYQKNIKVKKSSANQKRKFEKKILGGGNSDIFGMFRSDPWKDDPF